MFKLRKKTLTLLTLIVVAIATFAFAINLLVSSNTAKASDGVKLEDFFEEAGTKDDPYLIETFEDWDAFVENSTEDNEYYKGLYFKLNTPQNFDIIWEVGYDKTKMKQYGVDFVFSEKAIEHFAGHFDGDNKTLYLSASGTDFRGQIKYSQEAFGIFVNIEEGGVVENTKAKTYSWLNSVSGPNNSKFGLLCGTNNGTIKNCETPLMSDWMGVYASSHNAYPTAGGICAVNNGVIEGCTSALWGTEKIMEICAFNGENGVITDCHGTSPEDAMALVGENKGLIEKSDSTNFILTKNNYGTIKDCVNKQAYAENIYEGAKIENSTTLATFIATNNYIVLENIDFAKSAVENNYGTIKDCTSQDIMCKNNYGSIIGCESKKALVSEGNGKVETYPYSGFSAIPGLIEDCQSVGIVAKNNYGTIKGSSSSADALVENENMGVIINCSAYKQIANNNNGIYASYIMYDLHGSIENCSYTGTDTSICLVNQNSGTIKNISSEKANIVGTNSGTVFKCFATIGSIATGDNSGTILSCEAPKGNLCAKNTSTGKIYNSASLTLCTTNEGTVKGCVSTNALPTASSTGTVDGLFYISSSGAGESATYANVAEKLNTWGSENIAETKDWFKWQTKSNALPVLTDENTDVAKVTPTKTAEMDGCTLNWYEKTKVLIIKASEGGSGRLEDISSDTFREKWTNQYGVQWVGQSADYPVPTFIKDKLEISDNIDTIILDPSVKYVGCYTLSGTYSSKLIILGAETQLKISTASEMSIVYRDCVGCLTAMHGSNGNAHLDIFYPTAGTFDQFVGINDRYQYKSSSYLCQGVARLGMFCNYYFDGTNQSINTYQIIVPNIPNAIYGEASTRQLFASGLPMDVFKITANAVSVNDKMEQQKIESEASMDGSGFVNIPKEAEVDTENNYKATETLTFVCLYTGDTFTMSVDSYLKINKRDWAIEECKNTSWHTMDTGAAYTVTVSTLDWIDETADVSYSLVSGDDILSIDSSTGALTFNKKAGTAKIKYTVGGNTHHNGAEKEIDITVSLTNAYCQTLPKSTTLTYSGEEQSLVDLTDCTPVGGQLMFKVDSGSWATTAKATASGEYTISYYIKANVDGYADNGSEEKPLGSFKTKINVLVFEENPMTFKDDIDIYTYCADDIVPTLVCETYSFTAGTDYDIIFADGVDHKNVGEKIAFTVKFKGNCSGEFTMEFNIEKKTLTPSIGGDGYSKSYDTTVSIAETAYGVKLAISLDGVMPADIETVGATATLYEFETATLGEMTVVATGITLTGDGAKNYELSSDNVKGENGLIEAFALSNATITIISDDFKDDAKTYTGSEIKPEIKVTIKDALGNDVELSADTYFTVSYSNNTNAGTPSSQNPPQVNITAKSGSGVSGNSSKSFTINTLDISKATVELKETLTYNPANGGTEQTQLIKEFKFNDLDVTYSLSNNKQTNVKTDGDYTLTVTGTGNFSGSIDLNWNITPYELNDSKVTASTSDSFTYASDTKASDGIKVQIPTVTVKVNTDGNPTIDSKMFTTALSSGYDGKYGENKIEFTYSGNFSGSSTFTYTIAPKEITITSGASKEYKKSEPSFYYTPSGILDGVDDYADVLTGNLVRDEGEDVGEYNFTVSNVVVTEDYQTRYSVNFVNSGKFTITVRTILITDIIVSGSEEGDLIYDGTEKPIYIKIESDVADDNGYYTLQEGVDYDVSYQHENGSNSDCTSAGNITALITFKSSNFTGVTLKPYRIEKRQITVTGITAKDKVYDSTTEGEWQGTPVLNNVIPSDDGKVVLKTGDDDKIIGTATFATKNVGGNISVSFKDFELDGVAKDNYSLVQPESVLAKITKAKLHIANYEIKDKTYDGTVSVTLELGEFAEMLTDVISGDDVTMTALSAVFADKNAGANKSITFSATITGSDADNYEIEYPTDKIATINQKTVEIKGLTVQNKVYDGTVFAEIVKTNAQIDGVVSGDAINLSIVYGQANFIDKNVGDSKEVAFTGFSLGGSESGNYKIASQPEAVSANITKKDVVIKDMGVIDKVYDGTVDATVDDSEAYIDGVLDADKEKLSIVNGTATFNDKNVANGKTVVFTGFTLGGDEKDNYNLVGEPASITANITVRYVTVTPTATERAFDGTTEVEVSTVVNNVVSGEDVVAVVGGNVGLLEDAEVGEGKLVTVSGISLSGADAFNYALKVDANTDDRIAYTTVNITAKVLDTCEIDLDNDKFVFNGNANEPVVSIKDGTDELVLDKDFEISYEDNVHAGTATVKITLKGNYSGDFEKQFTIDKKLIEIIWPENDYKYSGESQTVVAKYIDVFGEEQNLSASYESDGTPTEFKEVGFYTVTLLVSDEDYQIPEDNRKDFEMKWVFDAKKFSDESEKEEIKVSSEGGISAHLKLVIEDLGVSKELNKSMKKVEEFKRTDIITSVYDVSLLNEDNVKVQPDGTLLVYILIPQGMEEKAFKVFHIHGDEIIYMDYEIEDGYAVVKTDKLSAFVFVDSSHPCIVHWFLIAVLLAFTAFFIVWWFIKKHRDYVYEDENGEKALDWWAIGVSAVELVGAILFTIFAKCIVCDVFVIINWVVWAVAVLFWLRKYLRWLLQQIARFFIWLGEKLLDLLGIEYTSRIIKKEVAVKDVVVNTVDETSAVSLKESLAVVASVGAVGKITKKSVADYIETTYGEGVEVNRRANTTKPATSKGRTEGLPLADTHYVLGSENRKCFTYVYETGGAVLLLVKAPSDYANGLSKEHRRVNLSAFPKSKDTWYSVPMDDSWNEPELYKMLDDLIKLNGDGKVKKINGSDNETATPSSLKESIARTVASGTKGAWSKAMIADHLEKTYGKDVEVNRRANETNPGRGKTEGLPLADTHYVLGGGDRKCFTYVYETGGAVLLLVKAPSDYANGLSKEHKRVNLSAFPKSKDTWYSVPMDDSWNEPELYKMLDDVIKLNQGVAIAEDIEDDEIESETVYDAKTGSFIRIMYNKSFTAKLIQSSDETKAYYNELKNYILSFKFNKKESTDRISWKHESFRLGRNLLVKMVFKGKTLCLCLPLDAKDYSDTKYHVEDMSKVKSYALAPTLYRIKNPRRNNYAKDLIDVVMAKFGGFKYENEKVDYAKDYPFEEVKPLINRGLIKVVDNNGNLSSPTEEKPKITLVKEVAATEVNKLMDDDQTVRFTEKSQRVADKTKKTLVNVDTLSKYFNNGEKVTLDELKKRVPSFDKKATYYKVCARGTLDKSLTVDADEFSVEAKKMILLTGGKVITSCSK